MSATQTIEVATAPAVSLATLPAPEPRTSAHLEVGDVVLSRSRTWAIIVCVASATALASFLNGVISVSLPALAADLDLDPGLLLWPASISSLTCGCTLLVCGALGDLLGARNLYAAGCFLQAIFNMASGLATTGTQIIAFRAFTGVAMSMCLPSAVSLVTHSFPPGKKRNIGFACMGGGQTIGFSAGLALGGLFVDTIGWKWSFHIGAVLSALILAVALGALPRTQVEPVSWNRISTSIDWTGALLASVTLSMSSYVLATITANIRNIKQPVSIALLVLSAASAVAFVLWVGRQERLGKPAIVPNSIWRNRHFSSVCLSVFIVWGACNAVETLASFYYQHVQGLTATETSGNASKPRDPAPLTGLVRLIPAPIGGAIANILMGLTVHRVKANVASFVAVTIAIAAPVLMATADPKWTYWAACFPAMLTNAVGVNTLYTISPLVITSLFPSRMQGVAGGVYNTIAQIGRSVGLTTSALIASSTSSRLGTNGQDASSLLEGYRAAFWYSFGLYMVTLVVIWWGLRTVGKVGAKRE